MLGVLRAGDGRRDVVLVGDLVDGDAGEARAARVVGQRLVGGAHAVRGVEQVGLLGVAHEEHARLGPQRGVDALEGVARDERHLDVGAVQADTLAVGEDARHEAGLVHVKEAQQLDGVATGGGAKAHAGLHELVDGRDRARAHVLLAQRDERVVHVREDQLDHEMIPFSSRGSASKRSIAMRICSMSTMPDRRPTRRPPAQMTRSR